jgi:GMP synthase (glutamine-hydrolysing)
MIEQIAPKGIILSGGPASVYEKDAPRLAAEFWERRRAPVLGICYGLQLIAAERGGQVSPAASREYGLARLRVNEPSSPLFAGLPPEMNVWMSHGDHLAGAPAGFRLTAETDSALNAFEDLSSRLFGVQFHPEVAHTTYGRELLANFVKNICGARADWTPQAIIEEQIEKIKAQVGDGRAVCGLSGGVDSTVAAALVQRAIGDRQTCIFVDNGLLREDEFAETYRLLTENLHLNVRGVEAGDRFLEALRGVSDPEEKRRRIGRLFVDVFEEEAQRIGRVDFLVQGTLYPDVIESVSVRGPSAVIKTHHNVGGLPERMRLKLIEPLRELFKDEVRVIGRALGIPEAILRRHPFPGPGLAVRLLGAVTREDLQILRRADRIVTDECTRAGVSDALWQAFAVLLPIQSVGVMGDQRTYERVVAVRAVNSTDGMTADWAHLPFELLGRISTRIISEVRGVNRVVYDISSKPPSTIEWE